jgi:hypothetical protein
MAVCRIDSECFGVLLGKPAGFPARHFTTTTTTTATPQHQRLEALQ